MLERALEILTPLCRAEFSTLPLGVYPPLGVHLVIIN
jgi:hypothetical protein